MATSSIPQDTESFMDELLNPHSQTTDHLFKTSMALSTDPPAPTTSSFPSTSSIEPLPTIDYHLVNCLLTMARPHLSTRRLKRMDYVVDARKGFYEGHAKFQIAYRDLQDAYACSETLARKNQDVQDQLSSLRLRLSPNNNNNNDSIDDESATTTTAALLREQLSTIDIQRRANNEDMRVRLAALRAKAKSRQDAAAWFSNVKVHFLNDEMPWLVELGKQSYAWAMEQEREQRKGRSTGSPATSSSTSSSSSPPISPHVKNLLRRVESDHHTHTHNPDLGSDNNNSSSNEGDLSMFLSEAEMRDSVGWTDGWVGE